MNVLTKIDTLLTLFFYIPTVKSKILSLKEVIKYLRWNLLARGLQIILYMLYPLG